MRMKPHLISFAPTTLCLLHGAGIRQGSLAMTVFSLFPWEPVSGRSTSVTCLSLRSVRQLAHDLSDDSSILEHLINEEKNIRHVEIS